METTTELNPTQPIQLDRRSTYQSSSIGTVNTVQRHRRLDLLGRGSIGPQAVDSGSARNGELLGGTQAGAGEPSGHHCDRYLRRPRGSGGGRVVDARRCERRSERGANGRWSCWDGVELMFRPTILAGHVSIRTRRVFRLHYRTLLTMDKILIPNTLNTTPLIVIPGIIF